MNARTILAYLFGRREAILEVAANRAALWTGIVLVLLTSIARNYDQTHVTEKPFLWLFGSLLFSLVSGTWVMWGSIGGFAIKEMDLSETERKTWLQWWPQFMGLFWMTAPIAWLYAIPVERFLDSLNATRANIALLIIVSLWRVALMARVFQVLFGVRYLLALAWVLVPAAGEVFLLTGLGGLGQALARGMGGMRNAPEEDLILQVVGVAFWGSIGLVFVGAVLAMKYDQRGYIRSFPPRHQGKVPWRALGIAAIAWTGTAIIPQIELSRNVHVEGLVAAKDYRAALDHLGRHTEADFAPSRPLPPEAFEWEVFKELPALFAVLSADDPEWVRRHFVNRLDQMLTHYRRYPFHNEEVWNRTAAFHQIDTVKFGILRFYAAGSDYVKILEALNRIPEGAAWLEAHEVYLQGLSEAAAERAVRLNSNSKPEAEQTADWLELERLLEQLGHTNQVRRIELGYEDAMEKSDEDGKP